MSNLSNQISLPQELPYELHDAGIVDIEAGPRKEATITVGLDDPRFPPHQLVRVRFGGITNFSEVAAYFVQVPAPVQPDWYRARIEEFGFAPDKVSRANKLVFRLTLEYLGPLTIRCRNITFFTSPTGDDAP
jgi:hypothetical protein